jgi:lipopolysaccharide export LptBFGC system permease protein LptF
MIASRLCCAQTMERVIDPLIADLQLEHAEANHEGHLWKGRWIRLVAGFALLKVIVLCGAGSLLSIDEGTMDEHRAMIRTVVVSAASMCAVVVLLMAPFWRTLLMAIQTQHAQMFVFLIPQALPLAIPIGLTIGILFGFRGRVLSGRLTRMVLTMAVAGSATSFAILVWLLPAANQSYREWMAGGYGIAQGTLRKGMNEMTLTELSGQIDSYQGTAMAGSRIVRDLTFSYHQRWSLACATAVLALFAVGVLARRPSARWTVGLAAIGACFAYYALLFLGRSAALAGTIPASAGAWFPNVVFVVLSALLLKIASARPEDPVPTR